jgi:dGTPase
LVAYLEHRCGGDAIVQKVLEKAAKHHAEHRNVDLSPAELNDISMQMFRVHAIGAMIPAVYGCFQSNREAIEAGTFTSDLLAAGEAAALCQALKDFDKAHAYKHKSVLAVEAEGYNTIRSLMTYLWNAITTRRDGKVIQSKRDRPFASLAYGRISENYRRVAESEKNAMPLRYREVQLLTDMISGMTDSFAVSLNHELTKYWDA